MAVPTSCLPKLFRRKPFRFQSAKVSDEPKKQKKTDQSLMKRSSSSGSGSFVLFMELRKKILTFRDIFDIPPRKGSVPIHELVIATAEDLHRIYPELIPRNPTSKLKERNTNQALVCFYDVLRCVGESWIEDKKKRDVFKRNMGNTPPQELVEVVVAMLDCINKAARERFDLMDEDEPKRDCCSSGSISIERKSVDLNLNNRTPLSSTPPTPTSVLPESPRYGEFGSYNYSSPRLWGLRVQAVEKLSPLDLKRLAIHMMPHLAGLDHSSRNQKIMMAEEPKKDAEQKVSVGKAMVSGVSEKSKDCTELAKSKLKKADHKKGVTDNGTYGNNGKVCDKAYPDEKNPVSMEIEAEGAVQLAAEIQGSKGKIVEEMQISPEIAPATKLMPEPASSLAHTHLSALPPEVIETESTSSPAFKLPSSPTFPCNEALPSPLPPSLPPPPPPSMTTELPVFPPIKTIYPICIPPPPPPPPTSSVMHTPSQLPWVTPPPPTPPSSQPPLTPCTPITPPPSPSAMSRQPPQLPDGAFPAASFPSAGAPPPPPPPRRSPPAPSLHGIGTQPLSLGASLPSLQMINSKGSIPVPPPPIPMKGGAPPPPPPGGGRTLRARVTKLKRSSHMGSLYRLLKGKVEGSASNCKSFQRKKGAGDNSSGGKQSMADALAEMTKRSAYFQQIEDDVQKHGQTVKELHAAINSFQTRDMEELLKFHSYIESHLEILTDESQVLSRFEGFPVKKLETLRMAAALYTKLNGMVSDLHNWKIEPPLGQLLDRVEKYFNKIKGEVEALERIKDEEMKKFQSHNIYFDCDIFVKIKEAMVDVSSSCTELALMERREANAASNDQTWAKSGGKQMICAKLLWRAFQLAFKVYSFAGGQDDRADILTRQLALEIEADPMHE